MDTLDDVLHAKPSISSSMHPQPGDITFEELPMEIILKIASYLTPSQVIEGLMATCRRIAEVFESEEYWRIRIKQQCGCSSGSYPIVPDTCDSSTVLWRKRCYIRETQYENFKHATTNMQSKVIGADQGGLHFGDINAMTFSQHGEYLATGGRDRQVILWHLKLLKEQPLLEDLASLQTLVFTHEFKIEQQLQAYQKRVTLFLDISPLQGAWDSTINIADLNHPMKTRSQTLRCSHAVTCHSWETGRLVAGTILGVVALFDPRSGSKPTMRKNQGQSEAILGIQMAEQHVIIVGSDRRLQVLDLRMNEFVVKKMIPNNDFGTKIHVNEGHLWVGTKHGKVLLYDLHDYDIVEDFTDNLGHTDHITGLHYDCGHILTCSLDKRANMVEPVRNPRSIWSHTSDAGFTAMAYSQNCTLALAWGPVYGLWWPKIHDI